MQKRRGISLIVLVITIIVMVILAGAIILTLNNSGIINKASEAVDVTNEANVRAVAQMAWSEAYLNTDKSQEKLEEYVLNKLREQKINIDEYAIKVTENGVSVAKKVVVDIVDTVPIPKGFVASQATGENTKDGGLVIYEGTIPVTDANVEDAKRTRNQYVWVPVNNFETEFVRGAYLNIRFSNTLGEERWEVELDLATNMPLPTQDMDYMTPETLAEVQAMYESVKEYKGFYIARYEAGTDIKKTSDNSKDEDGNIILEENIYSQMGKIPYTYIPWTKNNSMNEDTNGVVEVARSVYAATNSNYGAVSTLTYEVQWDRTLAWWLEVGAKDGKGNVVTSVREFGASYGNYKNNVINSQEELNEGALVWDYTASSKGSYVAKDSETLTYPKSDGMEWALSTGALKVASVNNICDMAGNMNEWTMGGSGSEYRVFRGGRFRGEPSSVANSGSNFPASSLYGFRLSLYIKK